MDRFNLFASPVQVGRVEGAAELNRELTRRFTEESESSPGVRRSNTGGWHSVPDLSLRREACYQDLIKEIVGHVRNATFELARARGLSADLPYRYGVQGWAMVMRDGDYAIVHDHAPSHWSVVYYVDAGDGDRSAHPQSGSLTFLDPGRGGASIPGLDLFPSQFSVEPEGGMVVVFPGWLQHFVHPYRGRRPRISVSCNIRLEPDARQSTGGTQ